MDAPIRDGRAEERTRRIMAFRCESRKPGRRSIRAIGFGIAINIINHSLSLTTDCSRRDCLRRCPPARTGVGGVGGTACHSTPARHPRPHPRALTDDDRVRLMAERWSKTERARL